VIILTKNEMRKACGAYYGEEMFIEVLVRKEEGDKLKELAVDWRMTLKGF